MLGKTEQKRFKNSILEEKIAFEKVYFQKVRACGGSGAATTQAIFKFTGGYRGLYTKVMHKSFLYNEPAVVMPQRSAAIELSQNTNVQNTQKTKIGPITAENDKNEVRTDFFLTEMVGFPLIYDVHNTIMMYNPVLYYNM